MSSGAELELMMIIPSPCSISTRHHTRRPFPFSKPRILDHVVPVCDQALSGLATRLTSFEKMGRLKASQRFRVTLWLASGAGF